jgi:hypothetical protein
MLGFNSCRRSARSWDLAVQVLQEFLGLLNLLSQALTPLDRVFGESAMGHSVSLAPRYTRASGSAMHAAAFFSFDRRRQAAFTTASLCSAAGALEHRSPITFMRTGHLAAYRLVVPPSFSFLLCMGLFWQIAP